MRQGKARQGKARKFGAGLALFGVVGACGDGGGCSTDPPEISVLEYIDVTTGEVLVARIVSQNVTASFDSGNLTPTLTDVPLENVRVRYRGIDGRRSDVYTFAQDLSLFKEQLLSSAELSASAHIDALGQLVDCEPSGAVRLAWSGSGDPRSTKLSPNPFWGGLSTPEPCGEASKPTGTGSVKTAIVYDRGECAFIEDGLQEVLAAKTKNSWNKLATTIYDILPDDIFDIDRHVHRVETYVAPGREPTDVTGGFVLASALTVNLPVPFIPLGVEAAYHFPISLDADGMVKAPPQELLLNITGGGLFADPISNEIIQAIVEGEIDDRLTEITDTLRASQFLDASRLVDLGNAAPECDPLIAAPLQCDAYRTLLGTVAFIGYDNMVSEQLIEDGGEQEALAETLRQGENWSCSAKRTCQLRIPAKRINIYPDAIELVWFDEKDVTSVPYALYVVAHAAEGGDRASAIRSLCRRTHSSFTSFEDGFQERFAGLGLAPCDSCPYCTECVLSGCSGCENGPCAACQCCEDEDGSCNACP